MRKKLSLLFMALFLFMGVPQMAQAAEYPYEVEVNLTQNVVTVYKKDAAGNYTVPDRAFVCSIGPATPTGTFRTTDKYVWRALFGNVYGQYATRITGSILFHSVPYYTMYDKGSLEYLEYNKLGTSASMGCVRLTVENAKWIYDNCPAGTTVRMVKNNNPLPIQPEQPQKLNIYDTKLRGWDPTDPDLANPWHKVLPDHARMESINVKSARSSFAVDAFYGGGTYYLTAEDAGKVFAQLGKTLSQPVQPADTIHAMGTTQITYEGKTTEISYCIYEGKTYYKLRDLAGATETDISWNAQTDDIVLSDGEEPNWFNRVFLRRNLAVEISA
ncbi:L,D-transpeptidase [Anaerotignum lactatifermentans]|uniref:L,D-transpeptidase catalytic domain n=1 Tax=Anaerotignum lactatifermentans DSM 14214 TaxID=1121323 RepID=A0A1M6QKI8_9FIRM|nr:L,D-transpeptidase [Anaerotignum lactatifermentans]SHK20761.1 L,D-transpeptidase catalytic domain [[Clostridium] lactatifermentans DSM 14214] [Anaerotignum lactatifermentans DSM 14214]